jgi:hypothetical protein
MHRIPTSAKTLQQIQWHVNEWDYFIMRVIGMQPCGPILMYKAKGPHTRQFLQADSYVRSHCLLSLSPMSKAHNLQMVCLVSLWAALPSQIIWQMRFSSLLVLMPWLTLPQNGLLPISSSTFGPSS